MSGAKIIDSIKEAIRGEIARVTIDGQTWAPLQKWQPIKTAPRDGTPILALYDNNLFYEHVVCWWGRDPTYPWDSKGNGFPEARITHWMPLPEPPK